LSNQAKQINTKWIKSILPFNIAIGPVSTLIALMILELHGTVLDVGFAVTLFNAFSIPAAIFWGLVTDYYFNRKILILFSNIGTAVILLLFTQAHSIYQIFLLYSLFSFITAAVTTPLNLLVMETNPKKNWSTAFAWFSMIISIGQACGLFLSMVWSAYFILSYLAIPLSILSFCSGILSMVMIKKPDICLERETILHSKYSFRERLKHIPFMFLKIPTSGDFKRVFRSLKYDLTLNTPVLILSIFMFYIASGIFNTSIVPSLSANNVPSISIFAVIAIVNLVQILSFRFAGAYDEKNSLRKASINGLALRGFCYALAGVCFFLVTGVWYAIPIAVLYSLGGGVAYSIYYTAANTMVYNAVDGRRGNASALGVYSALVAIATLMGSLISGLSSFYLGFGVTFMIASLGLGVSIWLLSLRKS
jgi:MFS family permease